jgi:hypothetical protein
MENFVNILKLVGMFLGIGLFSLAGLYLIGLLKNLAAKYNAEKVSARIFDAIEKVKMIVSLLSENALLTLSKESTKALADGVVSDKEVADLIDKLTDDAMNTITTEIPTLTKYFLGDNVKAFVTQLVKKYVIEYAKKKLGLGTLPLAQ